MREAKKSVLRITNPNLEVPLAPHLTQLTTPVNGPPLATCWGMSSKSGKKSAAGRRWSQRVTETSNALDLERGVFTFSSPKRIAASPKRSAEDELRRLFGKAPRPAPAHAG